MAFANFLGGLLPPPGSVPGFAGGSFGGIGNNPLEVNEMGGINDAFARNDALARQRPPERRKPGFGDILGLIGDALLTHNGRQPVWGPMLAQREADAKRQQMGETIANYLGNSDAALAEIMRDDPATGMALYKMTHQQEKEKPAFYRELEAAGFNPQQIQQIMKRRYTRPIIVGSAATGYGVLADDEGGEPEGMEGGGEVATVNSQEEYDALPPGTQYRDSQGNIGVKRGGPTASPSGVFPGQ